MWKYCELEAPTSEYLILYLRDNMEAVIRKTTEDFLQRNYTLKAQESAHVNSSFKSLTRENSEKILPD